MFEVLHLFNLIFYQSCFSIPFIFVEVVLNNLFSENMDRDSEESRSEFSARSEYETFFIRGVHRFYRSLGVLVARYAIPVIVFCTLLTIIGAIKTKHTP